MSRQPSKIPNIPAGADPSRRAFFSSLVRSGLTFAEFGLAIGYTGKSRSVHHRVSDKVRGRTMVTDMEVAAIQNAFGVHATRTPGVRQMAARVIGCK